MGKPIGEAEGEADKSALTAKYYAEHGPGVLADEHMDIDGSETWVAYEQLGGSEAFLVLDDADVEAAAAAAVKARFTNSGQSCACAKRFIVAASVADALPPPS